MKTVLVFGAGKSATVLINYLKQVVTTHQWQLIVADAHLPTAQRKTGTHPRARAVEVNVTVPDERTQLIHQATVVISLLPPHLHKLVAVDCVHIGRPLLTASYVDDEIRSLAPAIAEKGLLFLCEMGLDPGIDHMSAMQLVDEIRSKGGQITSFLSHCGGLVAPESDTNPWHYKISWNPRNIVRAGSAGAVFRQNNKTISKTYKEVFADCNALAVEGLPLLNWYPNRDSLGYMPLYQLEDTNTFIRTTLRYDGFCQGWHAVVKLDLTAEDDQALVATCRSYREWMQQKLHAATDTHSSLDQWLASVIPADQLNSVQQQLQFLELDTDAPLPTTANCSADILQHRLEQKLALAPADKDLVVMIHEITYQLNGQTHQVQSQLVVKGTDSEQTAMAATVGLPLGIAATLLLQEKLHLTGLHIPTHPAIYTPVLQQLEAVGIRFTHHASVKQ